ncbi:hypothetical protein [Streptosporangium sp. NPDC004631]
MVHPDLPPFSGDEPTCPKCGNEGASTRYVAHGACVHDASGNLVMGFASNERLHRECFRCDYAWDEAVTESQETRHLIASALKLSGVAEVTNNSGLPEPVLTEKQRRKAMGEFGDTHA